MNLVRPVIEEIAGNDEPAAIQSPFECLAAPPGILERRRREDQRAILIDNRSTRAQSRAASQVPVVERDFNGGMDVEISRRRLLRNTYRDFAQADLVIPGRCLDRFPAPGARVALFPDIAGNRLPGRAAEGNLASFQ